MLLNATENGMINCSLGDDGVPSYEDTCSFTCNTGYELTGSNTGTCQSNGSWSDSDDVCRRGKYVWSVQFHHIVIDSLVLAHFLKWFSKLMNIIQFIAT